MQSVSVQRALGMVWYGRCLWRLVGRRSVQVQLRIGTDNVTWQTLRAGIRAPPPEIPYVTHLLLKFNINFLWKLISNLYIRYRVKHNRVLREVG